MSKVKFDKEETKNLLSMLKSSDQENHIIAFEAIKNCNLTDYTGELLVLYKYAKLSLTDWKEHCSSAFKILEKLLGSDKTMSSPKILSIMTDNKASKGSIELFMEAFVLDMTGFLEQIGYPTEKIIIDIKLKD
tara:strand:- start:15231 stop:15629 length:399 start_codon:yes stop_codon:yes gene_type:complete